MRGLYLYNLFKINLSKHNDLSYYKLKFFIYFIMSLISRIHDARL